MDDRKTPQPRSPFTEALNSDPKKNAREAEKLYDAPDRREVTDVNNATPGKTEGTGNDPVTGVNVRKPI